KLLQLSFSLGFLVTTALVATSCNQPKTVTPKPTNPMQPGNGSGSETTTPGSGETMQPGSGSGTGTGTTTPDNSEAKNQLKTLIDGKDTKLAMYDDYSMIKSALDQAYETAKTVNDKENATKDELTNAKTILETAIAAAASSKDKFDKENKQLVDAFNSLKTTFKSIDLTNSLSTLGDDSIYDGIKNNVNEKYNTVKAIIDSGVQKNGLQEETLTEAKDALNTSISKISEQKTELEKYSAFNLFKLDNNNFKGSLLYSIMPTNSQSLVGFSQDFNNNEEGKRWRLAKRTILGAENDSDNLTNVRWIYNLNSETGTDKTPASYEVTFTYYGSKATLYFPYKLAKAEDINTKISLKYKLNDKNITDVDVSKAEVNGISVAKIDLTDLKFGENKIIFSTETGKNAPMIGNIYISATDATSNDIYNDIFGNEVDVNNPNKITVDFVKGYGLANKGFGLTSPKHDTIIKKLTGKLDGNDAPTKDYYLIGYLGNNAGGNMQQGSSNELYYSFYVNVPKEGDYEISGYYNSGATGNNERGLTFWNGMYGVTGDGKVAKFKSPMSGSWDNTLKTFNKNQKVDDTSGSLHLIKGLNKIIVSGRAWNKEAPNLGNVTFELKEPTSTNIMTNEMHTSDAAK
ncbi:hypothetical protein, partial [Mycoplasma bradburyae]|uniref:hypothetical protein n=1 Tax=Mycoplasma bradburyae TaxID=2963128 RepID=UPI002928F7FA|nr:hypothetical protein [Mycoplasma bradburyae]